MKFYECKTCGNIMILFEDSGVVPMCCGSTMELISPLGMDMSNEKHVPIIERDGNKVTITVSTSKHPMLNEHYIKWIILETDKGMYVRYLKPGEEPQASFTISDDEKIARAYEFCNIHSLWLGKYEK